MSDLRLLSNEQILSALHNKTIEERKLTLEIIELLEEVERRDLHLARGYGSLLEFCIKELKYSEASAYRRISAMRVTKELPQIKKSIESGSLNLVTVTQAHTFFRQEKKHQAKIYSKSEKLTLLQELENKSRREAEKVLVSKSPDLPKPEVVRQVTESETRITVTIDRDLLAQLDEIKLKYSHINLNPTYADLIRLMANEVLKTRKEQQRKASSPVKKRPVTEITPSTHHQKARSRHIPAALRHFIHLRDNGMCTYVDPKTKKKCGSRFQLEIDHIHPFSRGGTNEPENLRLACRNHNQFYWRELLDM